MASWSITSYSLIGASTVATISGAFAVLSGGAVYLELDDTNAGGINYRVSNLSKELRFSWSNGGAFSVIGRFTDPTGTTGYLQLDNTGLFLNTLPAGPQNVYKQIVGVEANPRFRWDTNGKVEWGAGAASAVDTVLERILAATLQVTGTLRATAAPSNIADLTRKDYVDAGDAAMVAKAGDTMTGLLILSGDPSAALGAATKQYVDGKIPTGGAVGGAPFTTGAVLYGQGSSTIGQDSLNFFWDATNKRLGLGNNSPATILDIANGAITLRQATANYTLTWANPAAARAISIPDPLGTDVFVFAAMTQTLTGKTLTGNIAATLGPSAGQQHSFPAVASDTIALLAAAQTLTSKTLTKPIQTSPVLTTTTPASAATLTPDLNTASVVFYVYNQATTINAPLNPVVGQTLYLRLTHDGTGTAYVLTWNAVYKRAGGTFTNTNTANAVDTITFLYDGTIWAEVGRALALA